MTSNSPRAAYQGPKESYSLETIACWRVDSSGSDETPHGRKTDNTSPSLRTATRRKTHAFNENSIHIDLAVNTFKTQSPHMPHGRRPSCQRVGLFVVPYFLPITDNTAPLSPHNTTDHIHVRYAFGAVACLYATMKLHCVFGWEIAVCICERANLYRHLSKKPLPQTCKVRLAHRLHRA